MLKLQPNPTFRASVGITVPGESKPALVDIEFRHQPKEKLVEFTKRLADGRSDVEILEEILVGWKGVDAEYSPSALRDLLSNYPASGLEILKAYLAELSESRRKNS